PEIAPVYAGSYRRMLIRDFPYGIFCQAQPTRLVIAAIMDLSKTREPSSGNCSDPAAVNEIGLTGAPFLCAARRRIWTRLSRSSVPVVDGRPRSSLDIQ